VKKLLDDAEIQYAYLPPYSPDLNPIEEAFAELKAWLRKHKRQADNFDTLGEFMEHALGSLETNAAGHFTRSRIGKPIPAGDENDYWDD
jgi:hypothetical protein